MQYLLPCPQCDRKLTVDATQAGDQIQCACGASIEVPSLRDIRALEPSRTAAAAPEPRRWDLRRGIVFAVGSVIIFSGVVMALFAGLGLLSSAAGERPREDLDPLFEQIDEMGPAETMDAWTYFREQGLGPYRMSNYAKLREVERRLGWILAIGLGVIALGVLVAVSAWWLPKSKLT